MDLLRHRRPRDRRVRPGLVHRGGADERGRHRGVRLEVAERHLGQRARALEDGRVEGRDAAELDALARVARGAQRVEERHVEREVVGLDGAARQELAQHVDGVLRLARGEVGAREVVERVPEALVVARHAREVLPRLFAVTAEERASGGLEAPARAVEELRGLVVLAVGLQRGGGRGQAAGRAEERRGLVVLLELDVESGRFLVLRGRLERLGGRGRGAAPLVERGRPLRAARLLPCVAGLHELARLLVEARGTERLPRPPPRLRRRDEVAPRLGLARKELLRRLLVARAGRRERRLREGAALLEGLHGLRRPAALDEELPGEEVLLRRAERLGRLAGPAGHPVGLTRALPERRAHGAARRPFRELSTCLREGAVVAQRLGDLREAVPASGRAGELERLDAGLLRGGGLPRRLPRARRLPQVCVARVLVEPCGLGGISVAHLERGEARERPSFLEHPARAAHVARLQVRVAGTDPVPRGGVAAGELGVGERRLSETDREEAEEEAQEVDREPQSRGAAEQAEEGRRGDVLRGRAQRRGPEKLRAGRENLVEVGDDEAAEAEDEKEGGRPQPVPDRDAPQVQGVHEEPPEQEDDEKRADLRREVEAVLHQRPRQLVGGRVRARPVHGANQPELGREREDQRREIVFPGSAGHGYGDYERSGRRAR